MVGLGERWRKDDHDEFRSSRQAARAMMRRSGALLLATLAFLARPVLALMPSTAAPHHLHHRHRLSPRAHRVQVRSCRCRGDSMT